MEYKLRRNRKTVVTRIKEYYKVKKDKKRLVHLNKSHETKIKLFDRHRNPQKILDKKIKKERKKVKKERRKQKILDLMRKIRLWRRKGYYGTYKLEGELKKLKKQK